MNLLCLALALSPVLLAQAVQGTVANAGNQAPLPGVTVQLRQAGNIVQQTVTDSQGAFRFQTVNPGDYTAEFGKPGFQPPARSSPVRRPFHVAAGANPIRLDAFMVQLAKVSGRVTGGGTPIRGADVQLFLAGNLIGSMVATDEHGGFHFEDVAPGVYTLSARPPLGNETWRSRRVVSP